MCIMMSSVHVHARCSDAAWAALSDKTCVVRVDFTTFKHALRATPLVIPNALFGAQCAFRFAGMILGGAAVQACVLSVWNSMRSAEFVQVHVRLPRDDAPIVSLLLLALTSVFSRITHCDARGCCYDDTRVILLERWVDSVDMFSPSNEWVREHLPTDTIRGLFSEDSASLNTLSEEPPTVEDFTELPALSSPRHSPSTAGLTSSSTSSDEEPLPVPRARARRRWRARGNSTRVEK